MTLFETIRTPLAHDVESSYQFSYNPEKKTWTVTGHIAIHSPSEKIDLDKDVKWEFSNRLVASYEPKLKIREALKEWGLDQRPNAEALYEILDMQFRNERGKHLDEIFGVYEAR